MNSFRSSPKSLSRSLQVIFIVALANVLIGALIILMIGSDPWVAYRALLSSSLGDASALTNVLTRATPLLLSGLAAAVAFRAGIFNLGGEGQIYLGAFAAAWVGFTFTSLPAPLHLPLAIAAAALAGLLGASLPGWLRVRFGVDEVISTLLLNPVYILFTSYLATGPFRDPARWSGTTPQIAESANLPVLLASSGLNAGILISLILVVIMEWMFTSTDLGYRWKMCGLNPSFAQYGGLEVKRDRMLAMLFSGALAGLAGGVLVCGSQYRFWAQIGGGIGWDGILIALLAGNQPLGVLFAGLLFAVVKTGSLGMESASGVPSELTNLLLALLILLIAGRQFVLLLFRRRQASLAAAGD
jgi:simple sugar transport system permease protein